MEETVAVAADGWGKLKDAFKEECEKINVRPHRYDLECVEPDEFQFDVNRFMGGLRTAALSFQFQQIPPRIYWTNHLKRNVEREGYLDLGTTSKHVTYGIGRTGVVLGEFVARKMMDLVKA
jgi:hypothetical protein